MDGWMGVKTWFKQLLSRVQKCWLYKMTLILSDLTYDRRDREIEVHPEGKFFVAKFEFGGSFGMSLRSLG
jgi:hypothetical protein